MARFVDNPHVEVSQVDNLYHFGLTTDNIDMPGTFQDVQLVCMGGSPKRMAHFAEILHQQFGDKFSDGRSSAKNLSRTDRYALFKVGPVLLVSHGIGMDSLSVCLNEILKLLHHSKCDPDRIRFLRCGTCGGLGLAEGTLVISTAALNELLEPNYEQFVLGKRKLLDSPLDEQFGNQLETIAHRQKLPVAKGKTLAAHDFYEGQARLGGAFCDYTEQQAIAYLIRALEAGVVNIEMESVCFAAFTHRLGLKATLLCVVLANRMRTEKIGANVALSHDECENRLYTVVSEYISTNILPPATNCFNLN